MSKTVVRSRATTRRRCRGCGTSLRAPRWLCSRCELTDKSVTTRKMVDTDTQVQALRRNTGKACVSIASSLDTLPPASVPYEMRCVRPRVPWPWSRSGSPRPPRPRDKCRPLRARHPDEAAGEAGGVPEVTYRVGSRSHSSMVTVWGFSRAPSACSRPSAPRLRASRRNQSSGLPGIRDAMRWPWGTEHCSVRGQREAAG
jgi:hypothetical protein